MFPILIVVIGKLQWTATMSSHVNVQIDFVTALFQLPPQENVVGFTALTRVPNLDALAHDLLVHTLLGLCSISNLLHPKLGNVFLDHVQNPQSRITK